MGLMASIASVATIISTAIGFRSLFQKSKRASDPVVSVKDSPGAVVVANSPGTTVVEHSTTDPDEEPDVQGMRRVFEASTGAGRTAAELILKYGLSEKAQQVFDAFRATPVKTDEAYPYAALCILHGRADDRQAMGDVMQTAPNTVAVSDILAAIEDLDDQ